MKMISRIFYGIIVCLLFYVVILGFFTSWNWQLIKQGFGCPVKNNNAMTEADFEKRIKQLRKGDSVFHLKHFKSDFKVISLETKTIIIWRGFLGNMRFDIRQVEIHHDGKVITNIGKISYADEVANF